MALISISLPLSSSRPMAAMSQNSSITSSSISIPKPPVILVMPPSSRNYGGHLLRPCKRRSLQVVRMAREEEKMSRRSPLDLPIVSKPLPKRRTGKSNWPVEEGGKEQKWTQEGSITESLPNGMFRVRLDNGNLVLGYVSGKIRQSFIRILPGDRVRVEVNRYDSTRGRIVYRLRSKGAKD